MADDIAPKSFLLTSALADYLVGHGSPPDAVQRALIDETRAEIILPLGGALIPYVVDPNDLAKATGVQVLNTKAIGIRFAEMCVAFGMTQSNLTYPRAKLSYDDFVKSA